MLIGRKESINKITKTPLDEEHFKRLETWKAVYKGNYDEFHKMHYSTINNRNKQRRRHSLNMSKVSCEELAKLIFTEKVDINITSKDNANIAEEIKIGILKENRFFKVFQNKLETMFALGGLILKTNIKVSAEEVYKLGVTYVTPDSFIPISYDNDEVTEGVFLTVSREKDKIYVLFEFHEWKVITNDNDEIVKAYVITNNLYEGDSSGDDLKKIPLEVKYPDLDKITTIEGLTNPLFTYIKPNINNNFDLNSPTGISIFANSLDTLYALDVAFDSFIREFSLGKRRIIVPTTAIQTIMDPNTGEVSRYFDADDEVYQAMNMMDPEKQKIVDNTVPIRSKDFIDSINALLNLLSLQMGFSPGTFTFDGQSMKTATEVVSEKSKTYQTKQAHENVVEEGLDKFIRSLAEVAMLYDIIDDLDLEKLEVEFSWDDSIIQDRDADLEFNLKLQTAKIVSKKYVLMEILGFTEQQAVDMLDEVSKETSADLPDIEDPNDLSDMDTEGGSQGEIE